ncbi:peptidoglycan synthetase [Yersinia intermedia]|uniref:biosynthetic peptidoglycan transglycosylase n=1 Tax=Yersinia intermedia TaxID=631 RepID=UPI0005E1BDF7|nr:biosynthetic peptidoglycan transglycosylase [Yersinia intermedia]MDA5512656.1 transglycosylase domain-containing protein [Yersinia intermedia]CNH46157.1 peptidoglycan synthetase [Yersinia intermedia]CQD77441.1 peptidoglycan synthetase [Yersinia intermedia]
MKNCDGWFLLKNKVKKLQVEIDNWNISPVLITMLIAAEDHRFGRHHGVDFISILRAAWRTIFCGKREGASTIAMQLVRVLTGRYERTLRRKLSEMYLAWRLTKYVKQNDIPKLYLFVAYYGWRMNGLVQASHRLNVNLLDVTDFEAACIVARLKYPEPQNFNRLRDDKIKSRAKHIIRNLRNI